jgi:hypothetical protein
MKDRRPDLEAENDARKARRARAQSAWAKRDEWQAVMQDAYDFVAPHRLSTRWAKKSPGGYTLRMFDNTAAISWQRATGKLVQALFPPGTPWGRLEPGPGAGAYGLAAADGVEELNGLNRVVDAAFLDGAFDMSIHETASDAFISTGVLFVRRGDISRPVDFVNVSFDEVALDAGPYNEVHGIFWRRKWTNRTISEAYPHGNFPPEFKEKLKSNGEEECVVCIDCIWDPPSVGGPGANRGPWRLTVYLKDDEERDIFEEYSFECPWIIMRLFRLPGQVFGLGPVIMNLPTTKTLNKAIELTLKSAAMAMMGIYTRIDDGVFDPENARMEPGAMWTVARNGGPLGPSLQRLPTGTDPNLANLAIQDLRAMVQAAYNDQTLPPDMGQPRSAAEIIQRVQSMASDDAGFFGRLIHEVAIPLRQRVMEILWSHGILKSRLRIDQLLIQCRIVSPMGSAFKARNAMQYFSWVQAMEAAQQGSSHIVTPIDEGFAQAGHDLGISAAGYPIYSAEQRAAAQQKAIAAAAAMAQQQQGQGDAPAPNGDPQQGAGA